MFTIDGLTWDIPCKIERVAEITPSEISGLMMDRSYFNDVLGVYMQYTIGIAVPLNMRDQYAQIYEAITSPVDGHSMTLPYNTGTITITARIANISDVYVRLADGETYWKGIQFTAIANHPSKAMSLGQMIVKGRAPLPEVSEPRIGDKWVYVESGWVPYVPTSYTDADNIAY